MVGKPIIVLLMTACNAAYNDSSKVAYQGCSRFPIKLRIRLPLGLLAGLLIRLLKAASKAAYNYA
eukprot:14607673-Alexandrium_andersonii.AAC.1